MTGSVRTDTFYDALFLKSLHCFSNPDSRITSLFRKFYHFNLSVTPLMVIRSFSFIKLLIIY